MPAETPEAPAVPPEEIIRRFTANEDKMKAAYDHFTFTQSLRVQELSTPGGEYNITGEFLYQAGRAAFRKIFPGRRNPR
jgi:hypothetical protein